MKVFLFGASGPTGQLIMQYLLEAGYTVKVLLRNPTTFSVPASNNLEVIQGNVFEETTYSKELLGCDVVVSALGFGKRLKANGIYSVGGQKIIHAMRQASIKKLIVITSNGVQPDDPAIRNGSWFYKYIGLWLARDIYRDMRQLEYHLEEASDINWIIVRPPKLVDAPLTRKYQIAILYSPGGTQIARADLAHFIVKQIESDEYIHKKVAISY